MERLLDVKELSEVLGVKRSTIYYWVFKNYIPHYHLGKLVRFKTDEIEDWLKKKGRDRNRGSKKCNKVLQRP